jgi:hypothetical protein
MKLMKEEALMDAKGIMSSAISQVFSKILDKRWK